MRRPTLKPWVVLLIAAALCCAPIWATGSDIQQKQDEKKEQAAAKPAAEGQPVPVPKPKPKSQAAGDAAKAADCEPTQVKTLVNTLEDVYGFSGNLEALAVPSKPAEPAAGEDEKKKKEDAATREVQWREKRSESKSD